MYKNGRIVRKYAALNEKLSLFGIVREYGIGSVSLNRLIVKTPANPSKKLPNGYSMRKKFHLRCPEMRPNLVLLSPRT